MTEASQPKDMITSILSFVVSGHIGRVLPGGESYPTGSRPALEPKCRNCLHPVFRIVGRGEDR